MKKTLLSSIRFLLIVAVVITGIANRVYSQSAACTGAVAITQDGTCATGGSVSDNTVSDAPSPGGCGTATRDGWYKFVATATSATVTTTSGNRQLLVQVFSGTCGALTQLGCVNNNTTAGAQTEVLTVTGLTIGTTYFIRLVNETSNTMSISSCCVNTPPTNDNCSGATTLTVTASCSSVSATNVGAGPSTGVGTPSCSTYGYNDVWFKFVAPSDNLEINAGAGTMTDAAMSLYSGSCGSLTEIQCDNDAGPGNMPYLSRCDFVAGTTYYIRVWGDGAVSGTFTMCVNNTGGASSASTNNCAGGTTVCNDASFSGNSSGSGTQELTAANQGCLSTEHQSSWYFFQAQTGGTIQLNITPSNGTDDYDFAVWGPFTTGVACPPCTSPLRCSWAAGGGTTGLSTGAADFSEGAGGNKFVAAINATSGQQFVMVIDNYTSSSSPFTLDWTVTGGGSLGCTLLPIELTAFAGTNEGNRNKLTWTTASEINNDYFTLERSTDGFNYAEMTRIPGTGNSSTPRSYEAYDGNPAALTYYRLKQTDFDGHSVYSNTVTVKNSLDYIFNVNVHPNPGSGNVFIDISSDMSTDVSLAVYDLTGRKIFGKDASVETGLTTHSVDVSAFNNGVYTVEIINQTSKRRSVTKLVKN